VSLPDETTAALRREARRRRLPVSQIVREALDSRLGLNEKPKHRFNFIGIGDSGGDGTISANIDELMKKRTVDRDP
jgi:hypothetical protein